MMREQFVSVKLWKLFRFFDTVKNDNRKNSRKWFHNLSKHLVSHNNESVDFLYSSSKVSSQAPRLSSAKNHLLTTAANDPPILTSLFLNP